MDIGDANLEVLAIIPGQQAETLLRHSSSACAGYEYHSRLVRFVATSASVRSRIVAVDGEPVSTYDEVRARCDRAKRCHGKTSVSLRFTNPAGAPQVTAASAAAAMYGHISKWDNYPALFAPPGFFAGRRRLYRPPGLLEALISSGISVKGVSARAHPP